MSQYLNKIQNGDFEKFNYSFLTDNQNQVLTKYVRIILKGNFWKKGQDNFTDTERQTIHFIKRKVFDIFPKKIKTFKNNQKEVKDIKDILNYLENIRKGE